MGVGTFDKYALEAWEFARCQRPDGSVYGTSGQCRKGKEVGAEESAPKKTKAPKEKKEPEATGLFMAGSGVDTWEVDRRAEQWRKDNGLNAFPNTIDWKHDRVHVLAHEFLGGSNKINEWIGEDRKGPSPAEETMINMVHRDAALKARGDAGLKRSDLENYFYRDINFLHGRGNIPDNQLGKYFKGASPDVDKFIDKFEEIRSRPNYDKLLDASASVFTNAGEYVFKEGGTISRKKAREFLNDPIVKEAMKTDGPHEVARLASMAGVLEKDGDLIALAAKLSPAKKG